MWLKRTRLDPDFDEEIKSHILLETDRLIGEGMDPEEARAAAIRAFGNVSLAKERFFESKRTMWLDHLWQDVRYAIRGFLRNPAFTFVAILTLGLGIGANTAIFSVVNSVLLRPLPYGNSDQIVRIIQSRPPGSGAQGVALRTGAINSNDFQSWRTQTETLLHMAAYRPVTYIYTETDEPTRIMGALISPVLFQLLETDIFMGRGFSADDEVPGNDGVVILSHRAWQKYFLGDSNILNRSVTLGNRGYVVVGVMPESFEFPNNQTEFWIPFSLQTGGRGSTVQTIARLAPGISIEAATAEANVLFAASQQADDGSRIELVRLKDELVAPVRPAIRVLVVAVGFVLLIACANVANLLLARGASRQTEVAIRASLGAGRLRLIRQGLTESVILALAGGVLATGLAFAGIQLLSVIGTANIPRLEDVRMDLTVFAFTLIVSILTGILFGMVPALRVARADYIQSIKEGGAASTSGVDLFGRNKTGRILAVTEIALALILLVGSGLLINSFLTLSSIDPGYDPENLLTFDLDVPLTPPPQQRLVYGQMLDRIRQLPGVRSAAFASGMPPRVGVMKQTFSIEGRLQPATPEEANINIVSHDYLRTMDIRVLEGRSFEETDRAGRSPVMLINRTSASLYFPDGTAVGERARVGANGDPVEIVGVVDDVRYTGLDVEPAPEVYVNMDQIESILFGPRPTLLMLRPLAFGVRTADDPLEIVPEVRSIVRQSDALLVVDNIATVEQRLSESIAQPRFYAVLLGVFAGIAVTLAAVGIYGLMAYSVSQRTREIGIRIALGAERREVLWLILREGLILAAIGIAAGILGALALTRYLKGMLFGLTPSDPLTFVVVSLVIASVAALASYIPTRRATKIDPIIALRYE